MINKDIYDVAIIGGGINGTAIAAEAASRGLRVFLCEQYDFGGATSSASSKLIHGGLRYLEFHEYALVKQALEEREILLCNAKHLVRPLNFILPYQKSARPKWIIRLGLYIYDHLARYSTLPRTKTLNLQTHVAGKYLKGDLKTAYQYSDCQTNDARLVIAKALQAATYQADLFNYTQALSVKGRKDFWEISLKDSLTQTTFHQKSRILINATGPWVNIFLNQNQLPSAHQVTLVQGSHIVVKRMYPEDFAFILQNDDNRVIFVMPYLEQFHLIGTTDVLFSQDPKQVQISQQEIDYLLAAVNKYFKHTVDRQAIIHTFSGVRPLVKSDSISPRKLSRDYAIELTHPDHAPPLISIFGGKLTTHRKLAESTIDLLQPFVRHLQASITGQTKLPGGDFKDEGTCISQLQNAFPWLKAPLLLRYFQQYGTDTYQLLSDCKTLADLGKNYGCDLYEREIDYLITHEWAKTAEDILWRRTSLGYFFSEAQTQLLEEMVART